MVELSVRTSTNDPPSSSYNKTANIPSTEGRLLTAKTRANLTTSTLIKFISLWSHYLHLKERRHFLIVTNVANSRNSQFLVSFSAFIKGGFFHLWIVKAISKITSRGLYCIIYTHCYFPKVSQQNKPPFYSKMKNNRCQNLVWNEK